MGVIDQWPSQATQKGASCVYIPNTGAFGVVGVLNDFVHDLVEYEFGVVVGMAARVDVDAYTDEEVIPLCHEQNLSITSKSSLDIFIDHRTKLLTNSPSLFHFSKIAPISSSGNFKLYLKMPQTSHNALIIPCSIPLCTILT